MNRYKILNFITIEFVFVFISISYSVFSNNIQAQPNNSSKGESPFINITQFLQRLGIQVTVEYETKSLVVLRGDEETFSNLNQDFSPLWRAVDFVKSKGYTVGEITTSGIGSEGNPTRMYVIMTKP